jgi:hypothetical protein
MMEYRKHGTVKTETSHIRAKRADRKNPHPNQNQVWVGHPTLTQKRHVQESDHGRRQYSVANANPLPVQG